MTAEERQRIFDTAACVLAKEIPHAWAVYVHGSFARGDEHPGSDLDLAVLLGPGEILPDKLSLIARIAALVGREPDIVNLREAGLDLIHALLNEGQTLLVRRPDDVLAWEAERMSEYAEFNPRRKGILARYLQDPLHT